MFRATNLSYSLNSLKRVLQRVIYRGIVEIIKGYARSLDYGSYRPFPVFAGPRYKPGAGLVGCYAYQVYTPTESSIGTYITWQSTYPQGPKEPRALKISRPNPVPLPTSF